MNIVEAVVQELLSILCCKKCSLRAYMVLLSVQVALPLCLFCGLVAPVQTAAFKLTLDTNRPPPPLAELFEDMLAQAQVNTMSSPTECFGACHACIFIKSLLCFEACLHTCQQYHVMRWQQHAVARNAYGGLQYAMHATQHANCLQTLVTTNTVRC